MIRRWRLATRLTWWTTLATTAPLALAFLVGGHFLGLSVAREVEGLVQEELREAVAFLRGADDPVTAFGPISEDFAAHHPGTPTAWRILEVGSGRVLGEYGQIELLEADAPSVTPSRTAIKLGGGRLTRSTVLTEDLTLGIVLHGGSHLVFLARYWTIAGGVFALTVLIALIVSRALARRVSARLREVAESVKAEHPGAPAPPALTESPEEIRDFADTLRQEFRQLREEAERIKVFTAGLAHELRSPIQNLIGQAEVALMKQDYSAPCRSLISSQLEELSDLGDAVDNLLTICTTSSVKPSVREEFDLTEEARLRLAREQARGERVGIQVQLRTSGDTRMSGDREHVLRGIRNVVANAVDWSSQGGSVDVAIEGEAEAIVVTVDDDGPGVPEGDRTHIFQPFAQGPRKDRTRIGYGLGLAIAKSAAEDHGGQVTVGSSPSGGARFSMIFARG